MNSLRGPHSRHAGSPFAELLNERSEKAFQLVASVGEEAFELIVALLVMVMVEHTYGQEGLGVYAYLTACMYAARYLADYGVSRYVEHQIAVAPDSRQQNGIIAGGYQAVLFTASAGVAVLLSTAGFDSAHTQIHERMAAYVILALILPLANLNHLKLAIMHGRGNHGRVARMRMLRHGLVLGIMFILKSVGLLPSYLLIAYLAADTVTALQMRRYVKLPPFRTALRQPRDVVGTLKKGQAYLFTDNGLDLLINIDLLVLGFFVTAWELGVYAQAAVLVRLFLIIPMGIKPILRRFYSAAAAKYAMKRLADLIARNSIILFSLHVIPAMLFALHFQAVLDFIFLTRADTAQTFKIFIIFIPGLVFYGPFSAQEAVYDALDQAKALKHLTLVVACINLLLTFYLVPAAGVYGAASATMITMLCHTWLFGRRTTVISPRDKTALFVSGLGVYLVYTLLKWLSWSPLLTIWIGPIMVCLVLYGCGVFGVQLSRETVSAVANEARQGKIQ